MLVRQQINVSSMLNRLACKLHVQYFENQQIIQSIGQSVGSVTQLALQLYSHLLDFFFLKENYNI